MSAINLRLWPQIRTRRARRFLVLLMGVMLALSILTPVGGIACVLLYFPLVRSGIPPMDDKSHLDERQWRVRAEAISLAYRILGLLALLVVVSPILAISAPGRIQFAALVVVVCLPAAILAWREPDPPQDEI